MTRATNVDGSWVARQRARGMTWSAIARMAGCNELDLRRQNEIDAPASDWMRRPINPRDAVRAALMTQGLNGDQAMILARLWMANTARRRSNELAAGIALNEAARLICAEAKKLARAKGVEFADVQGGFALTLDGVAAISAMTGIDREAAA